ncbi:beta-galactosidase, partial [Pelagicoccus sp. SDUM812002]|uniref:beta-galactosidase n=1 Tax=Pelagicoccus sp. SDUM812002 TaxID=3041266 RepID=UPI00280EF629
MKRTAMKRLLLLALILPSLALADSLPHLATKGTATQLIVDGKPFLARGGELGNSTASNRANLGQYWEKFQALNMNTVLAPVYWDRIEPTEGEFDFSSVDWLIEDARANDMKLALLWFASWKNSMSS